MTVLIIVGVTVALIIYDIIIAYTKKDRTITQVLQKYSRQYPIIPFGFGLLFGHLFGDF